MRISDWSSDVCSSDLSCVRRHARCGAARRTGGRRAGAAGAGSARQAARLGDAADVSRIWRLGQSAVREDRFACGRQDGGAQEMNATMASIQMSSGDEVIANLETAAHLLPEAPSRGARHPSLLQTTLLFCNTHTI